MHSNIYVRPCGAQSCFNFAKTTTPLFMHTYSPTHQSRWNASTGSSFLRGNTTQTAHIMQLTMSGQMGPHGASESAAPTWQPAALHSEVAMAVDGWVGQDFTTPENSTHREAVKQSWNSRCRPTYRISCGGWGAIFILL